MERLTKNIKYLYLLLSIIGGGFTYYFLFQGIIKNQGFNSLDLIKSTWIDNFYAKSITIDFWTGAIAGSIFMFFEGIRLKMKNLWIYILATVLIAFAFAFPLFLYFRMNYLEKKNV